MRDYGSYNFLHAKLLYSAKIAGSKGGQITVKIN